MNAGGANDRTANGGVGVVSTCAQRTTDYIDIAQNDGRSLAQTCLLRGGCC